MPNYCNLYLTFLLAIQSRVFTSYYHLDSDAKVLRIDVIAVSVRAPVLYRI